MWAVARGSAKPETSRAAWGPWRTEERRADEGEKLRACRGAERGAISQGGAYACIAVAGGSTGFTYRVVVSPHGSAARLPVAAGQRRRGTAGTTAPG